MSERGASPFEKGKSTPSPSFIKGGGLRGILKRKLQGVLKPHLFVSATGWFSRIFVIAGQLISIPIFYHQLGLQEFAVFTVVTGLVSWYGLMDFGIGSALQNFISEYRAKEKNPAELLEKVFPLIVLLCFMVMGTILLLGVFLKNWLLSKLHYDLSTFNFNCCLILYCWYFILLISSKIFFAYQKGFWGYFHQSIAYLVLILGMGIIHIFHIHFSLTGALYLWILPLFLSGLTGFIHAFWQAGAKMRFKWAQDFYQILFRRAIQFWLFSLSGSGVLAIDYLIIVKMLSAKSIVIYNIVNKVFIMMLYGYSVVLSALWPVLAEKYIQKTSKSLKEAAKDIRLSIAGGMIYMGLMTIGMIIFKHQIVEVFRISQDIQLSISLLLIFGLYGLIRVWTDTYATALQARSLMKIFLIQTPLQALVAIPSMIFLARYDLIGVMLALILSFVIIPAWVLPLQHYRTLRDFS
jgi:O-antigen/teichoic acid export membrane protein